MLTSLAFESGFSLERLASLCAISEAGSIGQASRGDANRQSQLSRQIADLERVFGTALLNRRGRPHRLTPEGEHLARIARSFFTATDDMRKVIQLNAKRVVVGAGEALIQWILFDACEAVKQKEDGLLFSFQNLDHSRMQTALVQGELDLALLRQEEFPSTVTIHGPWSYQYAPFLRDDPRQKVKIMRPEDLSLRPWAVLGGKGHFRQFLEMKAADMGGTLNVGIECSSYSQVALAIHSGDYAGFLPSFAASGFAGERNLQRQKMCESLFYERKIVLAWRAAAFGIRPFLEPVVRRLTKELDRVLGGRS
jgi:DNA-binding transcriptional LysR family regulator